MRNSHARDKRRAHHQSATRSAAPDRRRQRSQLRFATDLTERICASSIVTEEQPQGAVLLLLNVADCQDQNRIQVDSPPEQDDLVTIDHAIAMLTGLRRALALSRLNRAI